MPEQGQSSTGEQMVLHLKNNMKQSCGVRNTNVKPEEQVLHYAIQQSTLDEGPNLKRF